MNKPLNATELKAFFIQQFTQTLDSYLTDKDTTDEASKIVSSKEITIHSTQGTVTFQLNDLQVQPLDIQVWSPEDQCFITTEALD